MDKIKLIVCLLILSSPSRSQSTVDFYRQYIPPLYRDSAQYQSAFAANLQNAEATDPELVYAFLVCFNAENGSFERRSISELFKGSLHKKRSTQKLGFVRAAAAVFLAPRAPAERSGEIGPISE